MIFWKRKTRAPRKMIYQAAELRDQAMPGFDKGIPTFSPHQNCPTLDSIDDAAG